MNRKKQLNPKEKDVVAPRFKIVNRSDKRLFEREATKALSPLVKVEEGFFNALFSEDLAYSYQAIYHVYKERYEEAVERLRLTGFKMLKIDEDYFKQKYKPLEYVN